MPLPAEFQIPIAAAAGVFLLVLAAEKLHERRSRAVARLAVGPSGAPRDWVRLVPIVKATALGAMAWSLTTLLFATGGRFQADEADEDHRDSRHVLFVADVSPSMRLPDAGPKGEISRSQRALEVVDAILRRLDGDEVYSVFAFYTEALPVVVNAKDAALVRNIFNDLPIRYSMTRGKTNLQHGLVKTFEHLREQEYYPEDSTTVFLLTDGDTNEPYTKGTPPASVRDIYILGVGDPDQGTFIDDHMSRQETAQLSTLAGRLGGKYHNVNEKHLPTLALGGLARGNGAKKTSYGLADIAIFVFAGAAIAHMLIPLALEYFGSDWKTVRVNRPARMEGATR